MKYWTKGFSYLLNNEDMNPITAGLSIFVSMLSALTIIGLPVEVYLYGDAMVMRMFGGIFGVLTVNYIFLPKTFELKLYSIFRLDSKCIISIMSHNLIFNESFLKIRSSYIPMRYKSNIITNFTLVFGMGALLFHLMALSYLTALSFSTVINIPDWGSLLLLNTVGKDSKDCP